MTEQSTETRDIQVGIDGSKAAVAAALWAAEEARARDVTLHLVYVISTDFDHSILPDETMVELRYGREQLERAASAVKEQFEDVKLELDVKRGRLAPTLIALGDHAEMIVVGSVGIGFFPRMLLGSTAASVATDAKCSVAVVRAVPHKMTEHRVLVGITGRPSDALVVREAMREARLRRARILAVHAWDVPLGLFASKESLADGQQLAHAVIDNALADVGQNSDIVIEKQLVHGSLGRYMIELSDTSDLVVVAGGDPHRPDERLGSLAHNVIHHSGCPALIVR